MACTAPATEAFALAIELVLDGLRVGPFFLIDSPLLINSYSCEIEDKPMRQVFAFGPRQVAEDASGITAPDEATAGSIVVKLWRVVPQTGAGRRVAPKIAETGSHTYGPDVGVRARLVLLRLHAQETLPLAAGCVARALVGADQSSLTAPAPETAADVLPAGWRYLDPSDGDWCVAADEPR